MTPLPTYKYYLDGVLLVTEPEGWDSLQNKIQRVDEFGGIFITQEVELRFNSGDGYDIIHDKFIQNFCDTTEIIIYELDCNKQDYSIVCEGIIFVSDCQYYSGSAGCYLTSPIQDNSFYAKINNNKSIKTFVEVGKSKNGVTYTGATSYTLTLFDPCTGLAIAGPRYPHSVRVFEAFRSLVAFMTDDSVDFRSDFFDIGGDADGYCITDGLHLQSTSPTDYSSSTNIQKVCFIDLFNEMNRKFNLGMMIDTTGSRPVLVIEPASFFSNATDILNMPNVDNIITSIDSEKLYSQIHVGSNSIDGLGCPGGLAFPKEQTFFTYNDETYFVLGVCNIDSTLDMYSQWIIDSNIIQDCVINGTDSYDTDIFILQTTVFNPAIPTAGICVQGDPFNFGAGSVVRYYNEGLMNNNVVQRFLGGVPNSIAQTLAAVIDECYVLRTQTDTLPIMDVSNPLEGYEPVVFNDDTTPPYNDPGGNFTLGTGRYTAPVGGIYAFEAEFDYIESRSGPVEGDYYSIVNIVFHQWDSFGNPLITKSTTYTAAVIEDLITKNIWGARSFVMNAGDYITCEFNVYFTNTLDASQLQVQVKRGTFKTTYTSNGGGDVQVYDPNEYPAYLYEFQYPLKREDFQLLLDQPNYAVTFNTYNQPVIKAFIQEATYSRATGIAKFTCIASKSIQPT